MVSPFRMMKLPSFVFVLMVVAVGITSMSKTNGAISNDIGKKIERINKRGPYLGIVVPNSYEMNPLLNSSSFVADGEFPFLDFSGRRFRFGVLGNQKIIVAMTGLGMRNGDGANDDLALESSGDYTRNIGYLRFSDYNNATENGEPIENFLNNVWYQPEEIFPIYGTPEVRQHAFWVPVDKYYFIVAKKLEGLKLGSCVNTSCLPRTPVVVRVQKGVSANVFVDNGA
ncbi:hypothetical protein I3843_04G150500 [Carya illinoinensis]|nr:hypothetical protein I3843_04G150500 [Carya illinoinensis]